MDSVGSNACSARTRVTPYTSAEGAAEFGSEAGGSDGGDGRNISRRRAEITMAEREAKEKAEREGEEGIRKSETNAP